MFEERIEKLNGVSETPKKRLILLRKFVRYLGLAARQHTILFIKTNCFQSVRTSKGIRVIKSSFDAWFESQN